MTLHLSRPRAKRKWAGLLAVVALLTGLAGGAALAIHDGTTFELDKDATNNIVSVKIGVLKANINASTTTVVVCGSDVTSPADILIDGEQMHVTANVAAGGGGCSPKRSLTVQRAQNSTLGAAHSGGEDVTRLDVSGLAGDDWDQVYALANGNPSEKCTTIGAVECAFTPDAVNGSIFTTGGSKDDLDIPNWRHTDGSVPDADEITNAYAAKYVVGGNQILYFGADRFAVNGSKDFGFWFFRNPVVACSIAAPCDDGTPAGQFSGTHSGTAAAPGDILLLGTFTGGGATTTIRVFRWVGTGGTATQNGTVAGPDETLSDCLVSPEGFGCGTVNDTTIAVPWQYVGKGEATAKEIASGGFVEGGIDLTHFGLEGCFSSFIAETRSSPSVDAQLKDFILGQFEACSSGLTTTPTDASGTALVDNDNTPPATTLPDVSIGTGSVQVKDSAVLAVGGAPSFSGTLSFHLCGPIAGPALCTSGGASVAFDGTNPVTANGTYSSVAATITEVGRYCWRANFVSGTTGVPNASDSSATECFEVLPAPTTLDTTAGADVRIGSAVTDTASLSGTANKPGSGGGGTNGSINPSTPGLAAGGTITFTLLKNDCSTLATGTGTNPQNVTVAGDGSYGPVSFTPDATGTYHWKASYSGDSPNTLGSSHNGDCSDSDETVVVVDAKISIAANDVNRVGEAHTFTVTVSEDVGAGWVAAAGETVNTTLTGTGGMTGGTCGAATGTSGTGTTDSSGQCTVTVNSNATGVATVNASSSVSVGGITVSVSTNGSGNNSGPATKRWVDARIGIQGNDTNGIGEPHTFTVTLQKDLGDGSGFVAANGEDVDVTLTNVGGASYIVNAAASTCDVVGGPTHTNPDTSGAGQCVVVFTSNLAGSVTGNATSTLTVNTVQMTVSTTDANSQNPGPVTKVFRAGTLRWHKVDGNGDPLAGATFQYCRTDKLDSSTDPDTYVDEPGDDGVCVSVTDNSAPDADPADGEFLIQGLILGKYKVKETAAPAGYHIGNPNFVLAGQHSLTPLVLNLEIVTPFVNLRAFRLIVIGCDDITDLLEETTVWIDLNGDTIHDPGETKLSITVVPAHLIAMGVTQADLCGTDAVEAGTDIPADGLGGASYGALAPNTYSATMLIPN